jgi:hypothetical protein
MATATKKAPAKRPQKGTVDYLELALQNLNAARETAQHDARDQIVSAIDRIRETLTDVRDDIRRRTYGG